MGVRVKSSEQSVAQRVVAWSKVLLGDHAIKIGSGITPTGGSRIYRAEGRPFVRSQNVGWGNLNLEDIVFIDEATHSTFQETEIEQNDVLFNITGASIGRSALADARVVGGNVNQHVCIIRPKADQLNSNFLRYYLLSDFGQRQVASFQAGGNREGLNLGQIRTFELSLPPMEEQAQVAQALSDVDALIESLDKLITKKRDIKQAVIQEALNPKESWVSVRLGEIASFHKGKGLAKSDLRAHGSVPCIHYGELFTKYPECVREIQSYTEPKSDSFLSLTNDVLMPTSDVTPNGLATASCVTQDGIVLGGDILVIRCPPSVLNGTFLSYIIRWAKDQIMQLVTGTTVYHIYSADMKKFTLSFPKLSEQMDIVECLSEISGELSSLEKRRDKTKLLKQGMMQELLTGRIRLV